MRETISYVKTRTMVLMAIFIAIIIMQTVIPVLGFIPLGIMYATIIHVTVAIGACLLGVKAGATLGLVFGLGSMWRATFVPDFTSFMFSPFAPPIGGYSGDIRSVIICLIPRILVGIVAALVYQFIKRKGKQKLALIMAGALASITNTVLVMSGIYIFYANDYASVAGIIVEQLPCIIIGVVGTQGVLEAVIAAILTVAITSALLKINKE